MFLMFFSSINFLGFPWDMSEYDEFPLTTDITFCAFYLFFVFPNVLKLYCVLSVEVSFNFFVLLQLCIEILGRG